MLRITCVIRITMTSTFEGNIRDILEERSIVCFAIDVVHSRNMT